MKFIDYLPYGKIPEKLIPSVDVIINSPPKPNSNIPPEYHYYQSRLTDKKLEDYIREIIPFNCFIQYQIIRKGIPIHKDAKDRKVAINYLLSTGGNDVATTVYDENKITVLQQEIIRPGEWHYLLTNKFHGIDGQTFNSDRVAISVTPVEPDIFLESYGLINFNTSSKVGDLL